MYQSYSLDNYLLRKNKPFRRRQQINVDEFNDREKNHFVEVYDIDFNLIVSNSLSLVCPDGAGAALKRFLKMIAYKLSF